MCVNDENHSPTHPPSPIQAGLHFGFVVALAVVLGTPVHMYYAPGTSHSKPPRSPPSSYPFTHPPTILLLL